MIVKMVNNWVKDFETCFYFMKQLTQKNCNLIFIFGVEIFILILPS